jgi:hypothetical protein
MSRGHQSLLSPSQTRKRGSTSSWDLQENKRMSFHAFNGFFFHRDYTLLNVRDLAYFCPKCMDDDVKFYESKLHVKP